MDLEAQDHILNYQLPVAIQRYNIGLVIIDSITSNYRAEHSSTDAIALATRSNELAKLGHMLRNLAVEEDIAIVVANQVSDRFDMPDIPDDPDTDEDPSTQLDMPSQTGEDVGFPVEMSQPPMSQPVNIDFESTQQPPSDSQDPPSSSAIPSSQFYGYEDEDAFQKSHCDTDLTLEQAMSVNLQERFFTGWGDDFSPHTPLKNPAMGLFWSSQIACRIALKKEESGPGVAAGAYPAFTPETEEATEPESTDEKPISASEFLRSSQGQLNIDQDVEPRDIPAPDFRDRASPDSQPDSQDRTAPGSQDQDLECIPDRVTRRTMKLVFSPWTGGPTEEEEDPLPQTPPGRPTEPPTGEVDFEIWAGGLRSVSYAE
jgi:DNA repair protein RAD57